MDTPPATVEYTINALVSVDQRPVGADAILTAVANAGIISLHLSGWEIQPPIADAAATEEPESAPKSMFPQY